MPQVYRKDEPRGISDRLREPINESGDEYSDENHAVRLSDRSRDKERNRVQSEVAWGIC